MKDTFYFPHDYNAFNDEKIIKLRRALSMEGYGIYWNLIERLASSSDARLKIEDIENIAFDMQVNPCQIEDVIKNFNLFCFDKNYFYSERLCKHFKNRKEKSFKAKKSAMRRWAKDKQKVGDANAMRTQCDGNARKERKGKEIKERKGEESSDELKTSTHSASVKNICKILNLEINSFGVPIEDLIRKFSSKDLELVASKVAGKYYAAPRDQRWLRFVAWCETEKEKEKEFVKKNLSTIELLNNL